jgi:hypothetical protein
MLIYHKTTGLKEIKSPPFPAAKVGTYLQEESWRATRHGVPWKLRVKRRTKGSTWKQIPFNELPKEIKVEALLLGLTL